MRPNARENGQISPSTIVRAARRASSRPHLAAVLREGRKSANIYASLGFIRGIPVKSEGEFSDRILLSLILGPSEPNLRRYIFDSIRAKPKIFTGAGKSIGQSWVTIFARELLSEAAAENMEETEKNETIAQNWDNFVAVDLPRLTDEILQIASSAPT